MNYLRAFGQLESTQAFLSSLNEDKILRGQVHGVSLGYDEYWLSMVFGEMRSHWFDPPFFQFSRWHGVRDPVYDIAFSDLLSGYRPPGWEEHARRKGYVEWKSPIVIKVMLRSRDLARNPNLRRSFEGHPVVYQYRADCVAYSKTLDAGDSVGPKGKKEGTIGGFLENRSAGYSLLATCGHVVDASGSDAYSPSLPSDGTVPSIGQVDLKILPPEQPIGGTCNNRGNPKAARVDLALVKLDPNEAVPASSVGLYLTPIRVMTTGDRVVFEGLKSKRVEAEIKDLNLWREVKIGEKKHCFGDLFTIIPRYRVYVRTALAKEGDSGSWIMYDGPHSIIRSWEGMLIAGDGAEAYCCFAENILEECDSKYGVGNIVLP